MVLKHPWRLQVKLLVDCDPEQQFTASLEVCFGGMHVIDDDLSFLRMHPLMAWYVVEVESG